MLLIILSALLVFPLWVVLHEGSHLLAVKHTIGLSWWKIIPYPHRDENGSFWWARCLWKSGRNPLWHEEAMIAWAPRAVSYLGCILFPVFTTLELWPLAILAFGGLVDTLVGGLGMNPASDLQKAARVARRSPWLLRVECFVMLLLSLTFAIVFK